MSLLKTKIYILSIIAVFLIVGIFAFNLSANAQTADILDVYFQNDSNDPAYNGPLFNEVDFLPGDEVERYVKVTNLTDQTLPIAARAKNIIDPNFLATIMPLVVREGNQTVYSGTLNEFFQTDGIYLSDLAAGSETTYYFLVSLDTNDNSFQETELSFDIEVGEGTSESFGGEGNTGTVSGSGGSSGYSYFNLVIYNIQASAGETYADISWNTNKKATSRVIYDTVPHPDLSGSLSPDYGYANSSALFDAPAGSNGVTGHNVHLSGLIANTTYYYRPVSSASPEKTGQELSFTTGSGKNNPIVAGEEGKPYLTIKKTIKQKFANPGDEGIVYEILINNIGSLSAYNVQAGDKLPNGLVFSNLSGLERTWVLGNIGPGEYKKISYSVAVPLSTKNGVYTNLAWAKAENNDIVEDSADLKVGNVSVLGMELVPSGFSFGEFALLLGFAIISFVGAVVLKKKYTFDKQLLTKKQE